MISIGFNVQARLPLLPPISVAREIESPTTPATTHNDVVVKSSITSKPASPLDYLTLTDRRLIRAATGEDITPGQRPADRPVSSFAMQIAVDRERGRLQPGGPVTSAYLRSTAYRLDELGVPAHEFTGETLQRALDFLASGSGRHVDIAV